MGSASWQRDWVGPRSVGETLETSMDRLKDFKRLIPWAVFGNSLEQLAPKERKSKAGRKPIDRLRLFKMLVLQKVVQPQR